MYFAKWNRENKTLKKEIKLKFYRKSRTNNCAIKKNEEVRIKRIEIYDKGKVKGKWNNIKWGKERVKKGREKKSRWRRGARRERKRCWKKKERKQIE